MNLLFGSQRSPFMTHAAVGMCRLATLAYVIVMTTASALEVQPSVVERVNPGNTPYYQSPGPLQNNSNYQPPGSPMGPGNHPPGFTNQPPVEPLPPTALDPTSIQPAVATVAIETKNKPSGTGFDIREVLAQVTRERDLMRDENSRWLSRIWLLIGYSLALTGVTIWMGHRLLKRLEPPQTVVATAVKRTSTKSRALSRKEDEAATLQGSKEVAPGTTRIRNITITVRSPESSKILVKDGLPRPARAATTATEHFTRRTAISHRDSDLLPSPVLNRADSDMFPIPITPPGASAALGDGHTSQNNERASDEFPTTMDDHRQTTTEIHREEKAKADYSRLLRKPIFDIAAPSEKAFSMLEVMIAMAVLATVMSSVISSMYTVRTVQRSVVEERAVEQLAKNLAERINGADYGKLGAFQPYVWSWQRRLNPPSTFFHDGRAPMSDWDDPLYTTGSTKDPSGSTNLVTMGLLSKPIGVRDLKVYLEYYRCDDSANGWGNDNTGAWGYQIRNVFTNMQNSTNQKLFWQQVTSDSMLPAADKKRDFYMYDTSKNFGGMWSPNILVRIYITWTAQEGSLRSHELIFTRTNNTI